VKIKRSRKLVSILLTLAMLATLLVPMAGPAAAAGLSVNYVDVEKSLSDTATSGAFGSLYINETSDFKNIFGAAASAVTITLSLTGAEFPTVPTYSTTGSTATATQVGANTTTSVTFSVYGTAAGQENFQFNFGTLNIKNNYTGDIKVDVTSLDSQVTNGSYVIGRIAGVNNTVAALNTVDTSIGASNVSLGSIRVTETAIDNMQAGTITVELPSGMDFAGTGTTLAAMTNTAFTLSGTCAAQVTAASLSSNRTELTLTLSAINDGTRGFLDITPIIDVDYDGAVGDIKAVVKGSGNTRVSSTSVLVGTVKEQGVTVSVNTVRDQLAGTWGEDIDDIKLDATTSDSVNANKYVVMEIVGGKFTNLPTNTASIPTPGAGWVVQDANMTLYDSTNALNYSDKIVYRTPNPVTGTKFTISGLRIGTPISGSGEVKIKFSGTAGVAGEVVVAKATSPITAKAENVSQVKVGLQAQPVGDIIITENAAGNIDDQYTGATLPTEIYLECLDGYSFAARPTVEVVSGDLKLKENGLVYLGDNAEAPDGMYDRSTVKIDTKSRTATTLKFSNIKISSNRTVAEGPLYIRVKGSSMVNSAGAAAFNSSTIATVKVADVVTPAPQETKGSGMFIIGSGFFSMNGQMKLMDAAPYIKDGRTYVPVRYLANICGVPDTGIKWDDATQTVTLTKGATVVKMVVGSKTLTVGDKTVEMDVAAEISNGRTMLPARYVAEAFGAKVTWSESTQAVGIEF